MHDVWDVRAGKKLGFPSVTTVLGMVSKPGLEYWKREWAVLTADSNRREENEDPKDYFKRVEKIFNSSNKAADIGKMLHKFAEYRGSPLIVGYEDICGKIAKWQEENLGRGIAEESFAYTDLRIGGTIDWYGYDVNGNKTLVDWKSQKPKDGKLTFYKSWRGQLAAYSKGETSIRHISVVFSSDPKEPLLEWREYTKEEVKEALEYFLACRTVWEFENND